MALNAVTSRFTAWKRRVRIGGLVLAVASFAVCAWQVNAYHAAQQRLVEQAATQARNEAQRGSAAIEQVLRRVMAQAEGIASALRAGTLTRTTLAERLRNTVYADPDIAELGVAFAPFAWDPSIRLHGIAYTLQGRDIAPLMLDAAHDYTEPGTAWYEQPLAANGPVWIAPTRLDAAGTRVAIYALPFQLPGVAGSSGVVYIAYALRHLDTILDALELGAAGYRYVLSARGALLAHPNHDYLDTAATFVAPHVQKITAAIPALQGTLTVTVDDLSAREPTATRRDLIHIGLTFGLGVMLLAAVAAQFDRSAARRGWWISIAISLTCLAGIVYVLTVTYQFPDQIVHETAIPNKAALKPFLAAQNRAAFAQGHVLPLPLSTGIMVQSITFLSGKDLRVTGYVWQRYINGLHDGLTRGFLIPESDAFDATETYREKTADGELIGWSFRAVLHQAFDDVHFPFGEQQLRIPLWPKDFHRNVLLIPDLDAYPQTAPAARPGLRLGMTIPSWDIDTTAFGYAPRTYQASFGFDAKTVPSNLPELNLTITGKKQITGPFVTYLLPIAVVLMMLFIILILGHRDEQRLKLLGFDAMKVITACAGFFLVVIFSEVDLRKTLATRDIVYLEYFHFTAYTAILAVAINAIVFAHGNGGPQQRQDNFFSQKLYWPLVLFSIFAFTLATFH